MCEMCINVPWRTWHIALVGSWESVSKSMRVIFIRCPCPTFSIQGQYVVPIERLSVTELDKYPEVAPATRWPKDVHSRRAAVTTEKNKTWGSSVEGILPKWPYLPCVSMAGRALLAGYHRSQRENSSAVCMLVIGHVGSYCLEIRWFNAPYDRPSLI